MIMSWKYNAGLFLIATVVIIWVTSAEVTQDIFTDYKQPFAVTYLGASLMVVYHPIAFLKDWPCNLLKRSSSKTGKDVDTTKEFSDGFSSSSPRSRKFMEMELQGQLTKKDSGADLTVHDEAKPLVTKLKDDANVFIKADREQARLLGSRVNS